MHPLLQIYYILQCSFRWPRALRDNFYPVQPKGGWIRRLQVGCIGAGAFAAYMAVRWLQSPARYFQPDMAALSLPDASPATASPVTDSAESSHSSSLAAPVLADQLPDVSKSYVSTADFSPPEMMSTAEILRQSVSLHAKAECAPLAGIGHTTVMGAASVPRASLHCHIPSVHMVASSKGRVHLLGKD